MQLHYALFDQAESTNGNYWTWFPGKIQLPLLNKFQSDFAVKHLPSEPNLLQEDELWGGVVRLSNWTVVYRYYDGGYDKQQRPGRYVLLTAWIPADDAQRVDLLPIFTNEVFQHVSNNAKNIPVPPPFALKEEWDAEKINTDAYPFRDGKILFNDLDQAARTFTAVPSQRRAKFVIADLKIIRTAKEQTYELYVVPEPKPAVEENNSLDISKNKISQKQTEKNCSGQSGSKLKNIGFGVLLMFFIIFFIFFVLIHFSVFNTAPMSSNGSLIPLQQQTEDEQLQQIKEYFRQLTYEKQQQLMKDLKEIIDKKDVGAKPERSSLPPSENSDNKKSLLQRIWSRLFGS